MANTYHQPKSVMSIVRNAGPLNVSSSCPLRLRSRPQGHRRLRFSSHIHLSKSRCLSIPRREPIDN